MSSSQSSTSITPSSSSSSSPSAYILQSDTDPLTLTGLFCSNQQNFYRYIARYAADNNQSPSQSSASSTPTFKTISSNGTINDVHQNDNVNYPIRFFNVDNIEVILSPSMHWSFYNTILTTDLVADVQKNKYQYERKSGNQSKYDMKHHIDIAPELTLHHITQIAYKHRVPLRMTLKPATDSDSVGENQRILRQHRWLKMQSRADSYQYMDLYRQRERFVDTGTSSTNNSATSDNASAVSLNGYDYISDTWMRENILLLEIDDDAGDCIDFHSHERIKLPNHRSNADLKREWGDVLTRSFGFKQAEQHSRFYSSVWSRVHVSPTSHVRMFVAVRRDDYTVVGGSHLSVDMRSTSAYPSIEQPSGVATIFNVVSLPTYRGKGLGKALSIMCVRAAVDMNYRYILLQASPSGAPVYKRIGFESLPPYDAYVKLSTADWYCGVIEYIIGWVGTQHLFTALNRVDKWRQSIEYYRKRYLAGWGWGGRKEE